MAFEFEGGRPGLMLLGILVILAIIALMTVIFFPPSKDVKTEGERVQRLPTSE